jgi:glutathione S-transferase
MADLQLYVFDYNYSSWSMRAGVLLRASGLAFTEECLHLDDDTRATIGAISPSKLLPLLVHGSVRIWESLAIAEYVAEQCPNQLLWPRDPHARALSRAASAEMHAGFQPLRQQFPMNIRARFPNCPRSAEVERNVVRIKEMWRDLRKRFGQGGPYLCGPFGIVDAMFAPVVMRFRTYDVKLDGALADYADAVLEHPAIRSWLAEAAREEKRIPQVEYVVDH